ncbi:MAG: hypothetical protein JWP29_4759 [Rhodoferax sp.]|nr:hypothetical protein [Rhodoferax sp.]
MKSIRRLVCVAAMLVGNAQAALVSFDTPALIDIDPVTSVATYVESGLRFTGAAAAFLPIDGVGSGGSGGLVVLAGGLLRLSNAAGGVFTLASIDAGLFDPTGGGADLMAHALFADNSTQELLLPLGGLAAFAFTNWANLSEVTFSAQADFVLDNVLADTGAPGTVPEPASPYLMGAALVAYVMARRRRRT